MYQINRLSRNTLITPREVIFHAPTNHEIDERHILNNIIIAEERFIAPTLTRPFYDALLTAKHTVVTSDNQATMLTNINAYLTSIKEDVINSADIPIGTIINAKELMNSSYRTLWDLHLWKLITECVECVLIVPTWLQHTSQGQQKNNPEVIGGSGQNSVTGDRNDVKYKETKFIQDRIDPLIASLQYYLCKNKSAFPLYTASCGDEQDGIGLARKSPIIWNLYDDETSSCE